MTSTATSRTPKLNSKQPSPKPSSNMKSLATIRSSHLSAEEEIEQQFAQLLRALRITGEFPVAVAKIIGGTTLKHFSDWSYKNKFVPHKGMMLLIRKKQLPDSSTVVTMMGWRVKRQLVKSKFSFYTQPLSVPKKSTTPRGPIQEWGVKTKWSMEKSNVPITVNGETRLLWEWDAECYAEAAKNFPEVAKAKNYTRFSPHRLYTIWRRIFESNWSHEDAVTLPKGKKPEGHIKPKKTKKKKTV